MRRLSDNHLAAEAYLGQINFIMLHDELPPVQHPITIHFKKIHILNKISVDKWK